MIRPLLAAILVSSVACAARAPGELPRPAREESRIFVYAAPALDAATARAIAGAAAIRDDGVEFPLEPARGALLAWGAVPAGTYRGLALRLRPKGGNPEESRVDAEAPFRVAPDRGAIVLVDEREDEGAVGRSWRAFLPAERPTAVLGAVTVRGADALVLFDRTDARPVAVVPTGRGPGAVVLDAVRRRAYVALEREDAVEVVDLEGRVSIGRIPLIAGDAPSALALAASGRTLVVANRGSASVALLDPSARVERSRIAVGQEPLSVALDPAGRTAWVAATTPPGISVVDLDLGRASETIPTEAGPFRIRLDAAGRLLWVAHREAPSVAAYDVLLRTVATRIPLGSRPTAIEPDPRAARVYVARRDAPAVEVYEGASTFPTRTFPVFGRVDFLSLDAEGNALCMVLRDEGQLRLVGFVGGQTLSVLDTGPEPVEAVFFGSR